MTNNIKSILKTTPDNMKHLEENNLEEGQNLSVNSHINNKIGKKSHKRAFKFPK